MTLEFHPVANIFPMMSEREFADLVADVRQHGVREPIWLHRDGRVIDGRNRYRAAIEAGVGYETRAYGGEDDSLVSFVVSLNLHRRHLNESQRAMVADKVRNMRQGARTDLAPRANLPEVSTKDAAEMLSVSERSVKYAGKVRESAVPELAAKVESGEVAVSTAAVIAEATEEEQREVIAADDEKAIVRAANEIKRRKREERERQKERDRANADASPLVTLDSEIRHCSLIDLDLEPDSVDLFFTDPPYPHEYLPLWSDLGELAAKALKPGGLLVAYSGQMFLPEVMRRVEEHLPYWWMYSVTHVGAFFQLMARRTQVGWKPLVVYRKPGGKDSPPWVNDIVTEGRQEKTGHEWQQSEAEAAYWIDRLTSPGDLVVDPFLGSGTTAAVCKRLGRRFIGCDVDPLAVQRTKERVA